MNYKVNGTYDFSVYANSVLGATYKNAVLQAELNYDVAVKFDNIEAKQRNVAGKLPKGTPTNYKEFKYLLFKVDGQDVVVAEHWIVPDSVNLSGSKSATITIQNASDRDIILIRDQLRLLGLNFSIQ